MVCECPTAQRRSRLSGLDSESVCEAGVTRELFSVTDLCRYTDEIHALLDEINLLGDCDSHVEDPGDDTNDCVELQRFDSLVTINTWDSHRPQCPTTPTDLPDHRCQSSGSSDSRLSRPGARQMCGSLTSPLSLAQILLLVLCICQTVGLAISGDAPYLSPLVLPHIGYTRVSVFSSALSFLSTLLMLFVRVSRLDHVALVDWSLLHVCLFCVLSAVQTVCAALLLHQIAIYSRSYAWITQWTRTCIFATAMTGFCGGVLSLVIAWLPRLFPAASTRPMLAFSNETHLAIDKTCTSLAPPSDTEWNYQHPEPPIEGATSLVTDDSQHYLINNPYIDWHVQRGAYHLLPEQIRHQLLATSDTDNNGLHCQTTQ